MYNCKLPFQKYLILLFGGFGYLYKSFKVKNVIRNLSISSLF